MLQPQYTNCVSCISAFFVGGGGGGGGGGVLQIHITTSIHKLCILYQCLFCWGGGVCVTNPCYNLNTQTMYLVSVPFLLGGGGGGVTNPCYNLNTQTVYLVSVPFLLGGGGLQIHVTTSIHKLCILYQCLFCWGGGGGGAVTNPCYNLNTQTVYLVSVPFLLGGGGGGGGGCYKSILQPQYTNCVSCISAFFVGGGAVTNPYYNLNTQTVYLVSAPFLLGGGGGGGAVTNPCYNLNTQTVYLVSAPFWGPKLVHICSFE